MIQPRVLGTRALLKALEANEQTATGVLLPDRVREKETRGIVIAVGIPPFGEPEPPVAVGEVVVYAAGGTRAYTHPIAISLDKEEGGVSEELIVIEYDDILLVLEEVRVEA